MNFYIKQARCFCNGIVMKSSFKEMQQAGVHINFLSGDDVFGAITPAFLELINGEGEWS